MLVVRFVRSWLVMEMSKSPNGEALLGGQANNSIETSKWATAAAADSKDESFFSREKLSSPHWFYFYWTENGINSSSSFSSWSHSLPIRSVSERRGTLPIFSKSSEPPSPNCIISLAASEKQQHFSGQHVMALYNPSLIWHFCSSFSVAPPLLFFRMTITQSRFDRSELCCPPSKDKSSPINGFSLFGKLCF